MVLPELRGVEALRSCLRPAVLRVDRPPDRGVSSSRGMKMIAGPWHHARRAGSITKRFPVASLCSMRVVPRDCSASMVDMAVHGPQSRLDRTMKFVSRERTPTRVQNDEHCQMVYEVRSTDGGNLQRREYAADIVVVVDLLLTVVKDSYQVTPSFSETGQTITHFADQARLCGNDFLARLSPQEIADLEIP